MSLSHPTAFPSLAPLASNLLSISLGRFPSKTPPASLEAPAPNRKEILSLFRRVPMRIPALFVNSFQPALKRSFAVASVGSVENSLRMAASWSSPPISNTALESRSQVFEDEESLVNYHLAGWV